ncbi:MAG: glycoside hydrolase family 5 protein [Treponema sp.]|nr:glycoside hydrolase family 5 protein [Treponema sp.]
MKQRFSFTRILSFVFLILLTGGGALLSCDIITSPGNGSNSNSEITSKPDDSSDTENNQKPDENSKPNKPSESESTETAWNGAETLTWETNVSIPAEKFSAVSEGSRLIFSLTEIVSAEYHNIKIYENTTGKWQTLSSGNIDGAELSGSGSDAALKPTSDTVTYTLTASDATALKSSGLYINGYGVTLTKVEVVTKGTSSGNTPEPPTIPTTPTVTPNPPPVAQSGTPFESHGKLHVSGAYLYDEHDQKYQLYGMSTHGINFGPDFSRYVNKDALQTLRDEWNTNCIRLVLYPKGYGGYCAGGNQAELKQLMYDGIEYATELGMYVLVDWHVHEYNPQDTQEAAIAFLGEISQKYAEYENVLYEICNEPTGSPWSSTIKPYAQAVIPAIRTNAPNAVIIVGTNNWSQDLDEAWANKLDFANVMYTFHFYAGSHSNLKSRVENVITKGMPVFITEFGTCDASGNGGFNATESESWFALIKKYNISHMNWSLCNKGETASAISTGCSKTSGWVESDLTESGKLIYNHFRTLTR